MSETWLRPGSHFRMPGFVCRKGDRSDGYGGAAVFIRNHTPFSLVVNQFVCVKFPDSEQNELETGVFAGNAMTRKSPESANCNALLTLTPVEVYPGV
ncbi:hypothetical protein EVAR_88737_1 [Eumeta japonica]|uniref:Uncharacterized protein n=1 Tax=Eumeta variegata TaxID=151549 RepID=A0A4C1XF59_EUMVA|nr:hypothetical protein EVAR_88737_1 [Eumeta japonica]